jgi:hypothetical protein
MSRYLNACESGDLHTTVAIRDSPISGGQAILKADRNIADSKFYREFSYRDAVRSWVTPPTTEANPKK